MSMMIRTTSVVMAAALTLALAGCANASAQESEHARQPVRVLVIGDSLANPNNGCPTTCVGFVEQFTHHVAATLGVPAVSDTWSAMGVPEAASGVNATGPNADQVAAADIVVVQVGFNNALPDPETGIGCKTWFLDTEPKCLAEGVKTYGHLYDQVFRGIKKLRKDKPTVLIALTTIDGNISPPDEAPDGLLALYTSTGREAEAKAWAVAAYDRWNRMLTQRADAADFQVVDLYHAFNGPKGTEDLIPKYSSGDHINQAGNDLVAAQLARADLSELSR
jgi:hypothetical protein